ncbi:MAG TPA: phenylalanine--tRNA ligase subunit beta [Treponemataceae bacterium]|jgi:phenylalanyl-tRNA synthetase beta chain|nr:MAG: Phenylalanine--tRNA ligase beta subunit [Spirochaetes bacterium ADurb.Bin215]HOF84135.1 phenylalanine--tRNA ligase subunit beta [Treponemataceae bacterium]HOU37774.1 phenylalanine--tRNA ligase subunit beta [Treponemataceae bacterium]HPX13705.1 phenylalanine--tRNA ligase subunit beta [Treponemataceae bacterium]HQB87642.1 phenylalanine--tRNA ligase subunit beta [Treponemataceae bacterium]
MPKIEVNEKLFFNLLGTTLDYDELEARLTCGKAELDEKPDATLPEAERTIKIELNDTNRPDLWSTAGIARQLRQHAKLTVRGAKPVDYRSFFSTAEKACDSGNRVVTVDPGLKDIRPFMTAFVISGKPIDEPMLLDIIQTQEKLCWNYGRKRRSISMGIYRSANITWPVHYTAVDPDTTSFVPLACTEPMTCRQILTDHPKGKEYGWILQDMPKFPLLIDDKKEVLSMAPIINSATLGAVQVGDADLLVEMTGTDMPTLTLATSIVACDFADAGYTILPVRVEHPYDTGFGKTITTPYYFQEPTKASLATINRLLGSNLTADEAKYALERMGCSLSIDGDILTVRPPEYRNDFLHEVDVMEDVMMGMTVEYFTPTKPHDFTIGRLTPVTLYSRKVKNLMVGMGYQEMIFNYLGSGKDYIEKMNIAGTDAGNAVIEISNPMTENFQFVRPSILPSLLAAEAVSGNAVYPHKIFEAGKVAFRCEEENTGTRTRQYLGFLTASNNANFNDMASEVSTLLYYLDHEYTVVESQDPRFIAGRQASVLKSGKPVGIFGEIHPEVLENWDIGMPCSAAEFDLELLM